MITVYFTELLRPLPDKRLREIIASFPVDLQDKIKSYRRWEDGQACLVSRLQLLEGLGMMGFPELTLEDLLVTPLGKPYFDSPVHFNISHSAGAVVCAFSDQPIGIDVETVTRVNPGDFERFLLPGELSEINSAQKPRKAFFELWSRKEAVLKACGSGLSIPLTDVLIENQSAICRAQPWILHTEFLREKYVCSIASEEAQEIQWLDFPLPV